jgi:hypothetical protein
METQTVRDRRLQLIMLASACAGLLVGSALCETAHVLGQKAKDSQHQAQIAALNQQIDLLQKRNTTLAAEARSLLDANGKLQGAQREELSSATILYEPSSTSAPLTAAAQLVAMVSGHPLPAVAGYVPRWYIPARVKPTVYGDPRGMVLVYVDAQGRREGPFAPEILPQ